MNIKINKKKLLSALKILFKITTTRKTLPIILSVLFEKENNNIIGSVGISGDKGENDEKICIEAVKKNGLDTD